MLRLRHVKRGLEPKTINWKLCIMFLKELAKLKILPSMFNAGQRNTIQWWMLRMRGSKHRILWYSRQKITDILHIKPDILNIFSRKRLASMLYRTSLFILNTLSPAKIMIVKPLVPCIQKNSSVWVMIDIISYVNNTIFLLLNSKSEIYSDHHINLIFHIVRKSSNSNDIVLFPCSAKVQLKSSESHFHPA